MRIAIVTGASSGLGREFVRQIPAVYKELDEIWLIARRRERLVELAARTAVKVRILAGDLTGDAVFAELKAQLQTTGAEVRMLVNAAGFGKYGRLGTLDPGEQLQMVELNCRALTRLTFLCLPYMSRGSRIIQLSSAAAFTPQPSFTVYAATKAYVKSFAVSLRMEVKSQGIRVTCVCPGPVRTEFFGIAGSAPKFTGDRLLTTAPAVVRQALRASIRNQAVVVCGPYMRLLRVAAKLLPDVAAAYIMDIYNKFNN